MTEKNEELKKLQIEDDVDRNRVVWQHGCQSQSDSGKDRGRDLSARRLPASAGRETELAEGILSELMDILRVGENWTFKR